MTELLSTQDIRVTFGRGRAAVEVLHGISIDLAAGRTLGLVGESGSGKTTLGRVILGLVQPTNGILRFDGQDITRRNRRMQRRLANDIQVIFQDPYTSLNPSMMIEDILTEPLIAQGMRKRDARRQVKDVLDRVAMPSDSLTRYPREFSGGQRQRVAIARALTLNPRLIVCDEPVSALDLSTQAKVLDLLQELQEVTGVAYLFISHDLAVIQHVSHDVAVMYKGEIVETGPAAQIASEPRHPYTRRLWAASLTADPDKQEERRRVRLSLKELEPDEAELNA